MNHDFDLHLLPLANGARLPVIRGEEHDCAYLAGRRAAEGIALLAEFDGEAYQELMDNGFRRSGTFVYKPLCRACQACVPIRLPVDQFQPSRSQRRVKRRNQDLEVRIGPAEPDDMRWRLFRRYQEAQHDGSMCDTWQEFEHFLYLSPFDLLEFSYWLDGTLVGVGICDVCSTSLSSVYFYFDPDHRRRSLGIYSVLREIEACRARGLTHWYAGYYIADSHKMNYKQQFQPSEFLHPDGVWRRTLPNPRSATGPGGGTAGRDPGRQRPLKPHRAASLDSPSGNLH